MLLKLNVVSQKAYLSCLNIFNMNQFLSLSPLKWNERKRVKKKKTIYKERNVLLFGAFANAMEKCLLTCVYEQYKEHWHAKKEFHIFPPFWKIAKKKKEEIAEKILSKRQECFVTILVFLWRVFYFFFVYFFCMCCPSAIRTFTFIFSLSIFL